MLSLKEFYHLTELGVKFPYNEYGEYIGYKTDHDLKCRATSAGSRPRRQAAELAGWASNVFVKITITDTHGRSSGELLRRLAAEGIRLNVTAILTNEQVAMAAEAVSASPAAVISVFAGRIADTGRDPVPLMTQALEILRPYPNIELLWASPRELLNIFQADEIGCHIITATTDILKKLDLVGKDLSEFSLETVQMFVRDAELAGLEL